MKQDNLIEVRLVKRYKRFLADVKLSDGQVITVHCPNTGAMTGCAEPDSVVWISTSDNPKRKYSNTWELVQTPAGDMVNIHSAKANVLVLEAIQKGVIDELKGYDFIRTEVKYGEENSRIDIVLESDTQKCFVEVKSATLLLEEGLGVFPDAKSERGRKHLRELMSIKQQGQRAVLFFCVQHTGINRVAPADLIDEAYGEIFRAAMDCGVEVIAYKATVDPCSISLVAPVPVLERQP